MSRQSYPDDTGWNEPRSGRLTPPRSRGPRHSLGQRVAAWTSVVMVSVLVAGSLVIYAKYRADWDSIKRVNVLGIIGKQPPKFNNAENILLIGSDTRLNQHGVGGSVATAPGSRSDTLMLVHISPTHKVTVVSIPRETMVPIISCEASDGTQGQTAQPGQAQLMEDLRSGHRHSRRPLRRARLQRLREHHQRSWRRRGLPAVPRGRPGVRSGRQGGPEPHRRCAGARVLAHPRRPRLRV